MEDVLQGAVDFKRGIVGKWSKAYCVVKHQTFTVYENNSCWTKLCSFTPEESWISAANKKDSGLFVLNIRSGQTSSVKSPELYLFDTKVQESLIEWLKALQIAGWKSAVLGDRLRYHRRLVDSDIVSSFQGHSMDNIAVTSNLKHSSGIEDYAVTNPVSNDSNNNETSRLIRPLSETKLIEIESNNIIQLTECSHVITGSNQQELETSECQEKSSACSSSPCNKSKEQESTRCLSTTCNSEVSSHFPPTRVRDDLHSKIKVESFLINNDKSLQKSVVATSLSLVDKTSTGEYSEPVARSTNIDTAELKPMIGSISTNKEPDGEAENGNVASLTPDATVTENVLPVCVPEEKNQEETKRELEESCDLSGGIKGVLCSESGYCSKESLIAGDENKNFCKRDESNLENNSKELGCQFLSKKGENECTPAKANSMEAAGSFSLQGIEMEVQEDNNEECDLMKPEVLRKFQEVCSQHEKLSKRQSMTNLLAQLKNKMSINKRKGSKKGDRSNMNALFSTRLFWKDQDGWKDRWFQLNEHNLICYKDSTLKCDEFSIDIRKCVISTPKDNAMQGMNIFSLFTEEQREYQLAAWSDHHLQNWMKALRTFNDRGSLRYDSEYPETSESIVPFNEALDVHSERLRKSFANAKKLSSSSINRNEQGEQLHSQVSMDSGNDGDESESGLESSNGSLSDIKQFASRKKNQTNRRKMGINHREMSQSPTNLRLIENSECTSDRADSVYTVPSFDEEEYPAENSKPLDVLESRKSNSIQTDLNERQLGNTISLSSVAIGDSTNSFYNNKGRESSNCQISRLRQESIESSTSVSSLGSPTEKVGSVNNFRDHPAALPNRKCSVESFTSLESESEFNATKVKADGNSKSQGKGARQRESNKENKEETSAKEILLAEVLRQRDSASRNLYGRVRAESDTVRLAQARSNTVTGAVLQRPKVGSIGLIKRVSSQGTLTGVQNWNVKIENVDKISALDADTVELKPLSPTTIKETFSRDVLDVKPINIDSASNNDCRASASLGSEDSDEFFSIFCPESQAELERAVRTETLLRKRRNSLTLTRESISKRLESIKRKNNNSDESDYFKACICNLESQLEDITKEILTIETSLSLENEDLNEMTKRKRKMGKKANAVFSRLRHPLTSKSLNSSGSLSHKEFGFKLRKRSTSSLTVASYDSSFEKSKSALGHSKKASVSSEPRPGSSVSSTGSSLDLRIAEDDVVEQTPVNNGLKTRSKSVGNILQLMGNGSNGSSANLFLNPRQQRQRKISRDAISKIEDFMEFSREMVSELKSRKDSDEFVEVIEV